jgi:hypothetical protein
LLVSICHSPEAGAGIVASARLLRMTCLFIEIRL